MNVELVEGIETEDSNGAEPAAIETMGEKTKA